MSSSSVRKRDVWFFNVMLALEEHFHFSHISAIIWRKLWLGEEKLKKKSEKRRKNVTFLNESFKLSYYKNSK